MESDRSTTCSGCKWEHAPGRFQRKDEQTGYIWTCACPGTACANCKTGTPTNMHWGCVRYQKREPVPVQMTLWALFPPNPLDDIPEAEMVKRVGDAIGVVFTLSRFGDYRAKVGKSILDIQYQKYNTFDENNGKRFIGCGFTSGNSGASAPVDSIEDAIEWFEHYRREQWEQVARE